VSCTSFPPTLHPHPYLPHLPLCCRAEYTPFLHKLLLLRDAIREDLGLPGGLHEPARPDAFDELDDNVRALWSYRLGPPSEKSGVDLVAQSPLLVAASRGNVDAVHLLLLFGEALHGRRKQNERALYAAAEQGNMACVAALLGRVPLRPPVHPPHIARRLGLVRPVWRVYGPAYTYSAGVACGPYDLPAVVSATKIRAELASATGIATTAGPKASAAAAAARGRLGSLLGPAAGAGAGKAAANEPAPLSTIAAAVGQMQLWENDGRHRDWSHGYHVGTFWLPYDSALANYVAIHGPIGGDVDGGAVAPVASTATPRPSEAGGSIARPAALTGLKSAAERSLYAARRIAVTLFNLSARLDNRIAPGSFGPLVSLRKMREPGAVTPAYAAQALLVSQLQPGQLLSRAASTRRRGHIHPRLPEPLDYGRVAADAYAVKVRLNVGPSDGRTPLLAAVERGRTEVAFMLLAHHDPAGTAAAVVPELPHGDDGGSGGAGAGGGAGDGVPGAAAGAPQAAAAAGGGGGGGGAPAGAGAPTTAAAPVVAAAAAAPAPAPTPPSPERAALAAIASATSSALAVPLDALLTGDRSRREETMCELLQERRDRVFVDLCPDGQHTPLCLAAERGDERLVALLLHWGADVNKMGRKEARPLLAAAMASELGCAVDAGVSYPSSLQPPSVSCSASTPPTRSPIPPFPCVQPRTTSSHCCCGRAASCRWRTRWWRC